MIATNIICKLLAYWQYTDPLIWFHILLYFASNPYHERYNISFFLNRSSRKFNPTYLIDSWCSQGHPCSIDKFIKCILYLRHQSIDRILKHLGKKRADGDSIYRSHWWLLLWNQWCFKLSTTHPTNRRKKKIIFEFSLWLNMWACCVFVNSCMLVGCWIFFECLCAVQGCVCHLSVCECWQRHILRRI